MANPWTDYTNPLDRIPGARSDFEVAKAESRARISRIGLRRRGEGLAMIFGAVVLAIFTVSILLRAIGIG